MKLFDADRWAEIWSTLGKNRARTILTGFGVAWGIALLIIMLGSGKGLENGITRDMDGRASNSMVVWSSRTSIPYKGYQRGRSFSLKTEDAQIVTDRLPEVLLTCPRTQLGGYRGNANVVHHESAGEFPTFGDIPEYTEIEPVLMSEGRWLNETDMADQRKVCVIGKRVKQMLFDEGEEVVGNHVVINGVYFNVVGVFQSPKRGDRGESDNMRIHVPLSTYQIAFNGGNRVSWMGILMDPDADDDRVQQNVKKVLADVHSVHPEDLGAFGSWSMQGEFENIRGLFRGISALSFIVSIFSLLAGAIGVSNIMLVVVKERTKELGIRRAVGATPVQIVVQIISEALVLTVIAGFIGVLFGTWLMEAVDMLVGESVDNFLHPTVEVSVIIVAVAVLAFFGVMAGLLPAYRAVQVKPVDALRAE